MMLKQLTKSRNKKDLQITPKCIPFKTIDDFVQFDNTDNEMYDEVVSIKI